jgi:hypothetical protein
MRAPFTWAALPPWAYPTPPQFPLSRLSSRPPPSGGCGSVQCDSGANERFQGFFINVVALMEIDGTPGVAFEAGVEEA